MPIFFLGGKRNIFVHGLSRTHLKSTCSPHVCSRVRHNIQRLNLAQYNPRIGTNLKRCVSFPRKLLATQGCIHTILVRIVAYFCPSLMASTLTVVQVFFSSTPEYSRSTCSHHVRLRAGQIFSVLFGKIFKALFASIKLRLVCTIF